MRWRTWSRTRSGAGVRLLVLARSQTAVALDAGLVDERAESRFLLAVPDLAGSARLRGHQDPGVARLPHQLVIVEQLLEQALAGAESGEDDLDVASRTEAVASDQRVREV